MSHWSLIQTEPHSSLVMPVIETFSAARFIFIYVFDEFDFIPRYRGVRSGAPRVSCHSAGKEPFDVFKGAVSLSASLCETSDRAVLSLRHGEHANRGG